MNIKKYMFRIIFVISILGNILLVSIICLEKINSPKERYGTLSRDVEIGIFGDKNEIFTLPKGLTVRDASPQGIAAVDLFEPNRFSITVSTDKQDMVDYSEYIIKHEFGSLYSADIGSEDTIKIPN